MTITLNYDGRLVTLRATPWLRKQVRQGRISYAQAMQRCPYFCL